MIIDLDSWEAGYYDALLGRPSECTASLDQVSYSSCTQRKTAEGGPSSALSRATARWRPSANRHLRYQLADYRIPLEQVGLILKYISRLRGNCKARAAAGRR